MTPPCKNCARRAEPLRLGALLSIASAHPLQLTHWHTGTNPKKIGWDSECLLGQAPIFLYIVVSFVSIPKYVSWTWSDDTWAWKLHPSMVSLGLKPPSSSR